MKQRIITLLLLLFASFLLTGCDLFGGGDTTTATPTTTTTTTTEIVTTTENTTTEEITTSGTTTTENMGVYFEVVFYNGDNSILETQNVLEGTDAAIPATPTKTSTAQYTYTFYNWDQTYSNVTEDMDIYPVFIQTINYYTVNFYDGDSSILTTLSVPFGSAATEPATAPTKADSGTEKYTFTTWDKPFTNIVGDLEIYPLFSVSFNSELLYFLVEDMFGNDDPYNSFDSEEMAAELLVVSEMPSEEDLYNMLLDVWDLYLELFSVRTSTDLQAWYAATESIGLNKTLLITMFYNAMTTGVTNDLAYALEDFNYYTAEFAEKSQMLLDYNADLLALGAEAETYCLTGVNPLLIVECQEYWETLKQKNDLQQAFYMELDNVSWNDSNFNWDVWYDIENLQHEVLWVTEFSTDPSDITASQALLDAYIEGLITAEEVLYLPLMAMYVDYMSIEMILSGSTYSDLDVPDLGNVKNIRQHLEELFYGNQQDFVEGDKYYRGYVAYLQMIPNVEWSIQYITEELERADVRYADQQVTTGFLTDATNEANLKQLMGTVYDGLDAIMLAIDEETFNTVVDLVMDIMVQQININMDGPDINPQMYFTAENIMLVTGKLDMFIAAFYGTLDQIDYDNLKLLLLDYAEYSYTSEGLIPTEIDALLLSNGLLFDKFLTYFQFGVGEITNLLQSVDIVKATALAELAQQDFGMMTEIDITVLVSQGIDILIGDGSVDISLILQYMADIYFEVNQAATILPGDLTQLQTDIDIYITDVLLLIGIVKNYNSHLISASEVEVIFDLIARVQRIPSWFNDEVGFSTVTDPIEYYGDYLYEQFVNENFNGEPVFSVITNILDIFGMIDEEAAYYQVRSIQQYILGLTFSRDFVGIQDWVNNLESFGYTQAQMTDYLINYLQIYTTENKDGDSWFNEQLINLNNEIAFWQGEYDYADTQMQNIDAYIQGVIAGLDSLLIPDAELYWEASKEYHYRLFGYENVDWELAQQLDYLYIGDLKTIVEAIYTASDPLDQTALDVAIADYDAFVAMHGGDEDNYEGERLADLIARYKDYYYLYYSYNLDVYQPIVDIIDANLLYEDLIMEICWGEMYDAGMYAYYMLDQDWYVSEMSFRQEEIVDMYEGLTFIRVLDDLVNDTLIVPETTEAINLVLDDLQNMISAMPPESFALIEQVINMMMEMPNNDGQDESMDFYIPFTASELYAFSLDLSAFLKLRTQTLDAVDLDTLEAYILIVITEYVEDMNLDTVSEAAKILEMNTLVIKYIGFADVTLTEFTNLLDGLTEINIQMILDLIDDFTMGGDNIYSQVISVAQVLDEIYDPAQIDLDVIIDMIIEIYYDQADLTTLDMVDVQTAWKVYLTTIEALIPTVATYDPNVLDPLTYPNLLELQQRVMYLSYMFFDPEDIINNPPAFGYDNQLLEELIMELFNERE